MSEMVERVAAALHAAYAPRVFTITEVEDLARAAIAAMREPTKAMVDAGNDATYAVDDVWIMMIDEALK